MSFELGAGIEVLIDPPRTPTTLVVPTTGPAGPEGPTGPQGPMGPSGGAYRHTQSAPVLLVQVQHGLGFQPAGVVCVESDGSTIIEPASITWPVPGITEITFGVPFTGTVYVS